MADMEYISEEARGKGVGFCRIRRITGYLVGTLDRFNTAKRAEVRDRVKHDTSNGMSSPYELLEAFGG